MVLVLAIDTFQICHAEVAVCNVILHFPSNHWFTKCHLFLFLFLQFTKFLRMFCSKYGEQIAYRDALVSLQITLHMPFSLSS